MTTSTKNTVIILRHVGAALVAASNELAKISEVEKPTLTKEERIEAASSDAPADTKTAKTTKPAKDKVVEAEVVKEAPADDGFDDFAEVSETKKIEAEDVRAELRAFAKKHSREKAYELLADYNAKNVDELDPAKYAQFIADLKV